MPADEFAAASRDAARSLRRMPSDLRRTMGRHVRDEVAEPMAGAVRSSFVGPWAGVLAAGTRVRVDVNPAVVVGGARRVLSGGGSVRSVVYGEQWGGGRRVSPVSRRGARPYRVRSTRQFAGRGSRTLPDTFLRRAEQTYGAWLSVLDTYLDEWEGR